MPAAASPPLLPFGRAKPILALCVHLATRSLSPSTLQQPVTTATRILATRLPALLSRTYAPLVTKAALMHRPDVDLMSAARDQNLKLLQFMVDWSKEPEGRPLHYDSSDVVSDALAQDSPRVLDWLLNQPGLFVQWDWGYQLASAVCGSGNVEWRDWWKASGLHRFKDRIWFAEAAVDASRKGRVDILDWLLEQLGADGMAAIASSYYYGSAIVVAAQEGHVNVMDWWLGKVQSGTLPVAIEWLKVIKAGFDSGNGAVLEWCTNRPQAVETWQQAMKKKGDTDLHQRFRSICTQAVWKGIGLKWLHHFDLVQFARGNEHVSMQACANGDLQLVKELYARGDLIGSRKDLVASAVESGNLELLDWIQATVDSSVVSGDGDGWFDPFVTACQAGKVELLDWLIANGYAFPPPGQTRARVFYCAVSDQQVGVLEWLFKNGYANGVSLQEWSGCFEVASTKGSVNLLDWLADHISKLGDSPLNLSPRRPRARLLSTPFLHYAFSYGHVDVIEWWLKQSFGSVKHSFDLDHDKPYLDACTQYSDNAAGTLAALKVWHQAARPICFAECIHAASIHGRTDILDWLLRSTRASEEDFVKAWSDDDEFPDEITADNMYAHYWFDVDNHGKSLTWWRDNLPHIAALPINRGPYENPIHAYYLKHMVGNTSFELLEPFHAIEEYDGLVDLLEYWRQTGRVQEMEEDAERCLMAASEYGNCHVLDWWKASGMKMECPEEVVDGERKVWKEAKEWWAKSGLVSESQLAMIELRD